MAHKHISVRTEFLFTVTRERVEHTAHLFFMRFKKILIVNAGGGYSHTAES